MKISWQLSVETICSPCPHFYLSRVSKGECANEQESPAEQYSGKTCYSYSGSRQGLTAGPHLVPADPGDEAKPRPPANKAKRVRPWIAAAMGILNVGRGTTWLWGKSWLKSRQKAQDTGYTAESESAQRE